MESGSILTFIIVSFCSAAVLIMKRDALDARFRRPLAIMALIMVVTSFVLLLYAILNGTFAVK